MISTFKEEWFRNAILLIGITLLLSGCANLNTIDRATSFKSPDNKGKAIHLDIQQRLLVMNAVGKYCAEPSPDALAAFAAAAGLGASSPVKGALSGSGAASSSAASIGLRTQSITLMRDALYRMCEAYGNGMLSGPQVMTMLSRSQDLTAVVLATEQLTGAVAAQQAFLSGTSASDATAMMTATSQLLEAALKQQERAQSRLEKALERKTNAEGKQKQAQDEHREAQAGSSSNPGDDSAGQRARARFNMAKSDLEAANRQAILAENIRASRDKILETATERVETLQSVQDSATATASAASSSTAALSGGSDRSRLNDQSTQAIASAAQSMVNNVLNTSYLLDYCMATLSANDGKNTIVQDRDLCSQSILMTMTAEQLRVTESTKAVDTFDFNSIETINCIKSWLNSNIENKTKLDLWRKQKAGNVSHVIFMFGKSASGFRSSAVKDLSISCS